MRGAAGLLLALAFGGSTPAQCAASYVVGGVVVDSRSHAPLGNMRILLAPSSARDRKAERVTKQDGRFAFPVSEPGKYLLSITKPGYPLQFYKQTSLSGATTAVVVNESQDASHLVFEAKRGGVIFGVVKDEDGEPVRNARVTLFQSAVLSGSRRMIPRGQTRSNAAGEFRFPNLLRGSYYVLATGSAWFADSISGLEEAQQFAQSRLEVLAEQGREANGPPPKFSPDPAFRGAALQPMYYGNARSVEQASIIRLETGSEVQASIILPFTRAVALKGTLSVPDEASEGRVVLFNRVGDQFAVFMDTWVAKDKKFQFVNVPPGSYIIVAVSSAASATSGWGLDDEVEVGAVDAEVMLRPQQTGSLAGRVLFEGERPAPEASLFVTVHGEKTDFRYRAEVNPEGSYSLNRLQPDRYEVTAGDMGYIAAYLTGPSGERLPLTLSVSSGEALHRDLTLTRAASAIEGTVEKAGVPQIAAFVLLMPKDSSRQWAYRIDQTDSDGSYRLATIPSGDYFLIALGESEDVAYRDSKVATRLRQAAQTVHLEPGDHLTLKLDVVSAAALNLSSL